MVTLTGVTKRYGSLCAVDNVSCEIEQGECFALLGPNGAGKSTIVKMLLGFTRPTSGVVTINRVIAGHVDSRRQVGYLPELLLLPPYLSGIEYLERHTGLIGPTGLPAKKAIERIVEIVSMQGSERKRIGTYSKGMKQRIGLAAALLGSPKLIILDEPTSGLDPIGIRDIRRILEGLQAAGTTIILNSHQLSEVEKTCSTAGILYKGRLLVKDSIGAIVREGESLEDVFIRYVEGNV